ncbi:MAG TPA: CdaR family protein [Vicinamibacterales bacterium]|nr:CdaR family protein [Vicinamibacterales bacterium]
MAYNPFRHFWPKAVSVGIATLLWIMIGGEKQVERSLRAPLELQNVPPGLELVGDAPSAVDVRLRGSSSGLGRLVPGDVTAVVDVSGARVGRNLVNLTPGAVRVPFGIEVTYTGPATIFLVFEPQGTKRVPVVPALEGQPAPGYAVTGVRVDPSEVEIVGPTSALDEVRQATTETIEIDGLKGQVRHSVAIGVANGSARLREPRNAAVTVEIQPVLVERVLAIPVRLEDAGAGLAARAAPALVNVTVRGREGLVAALDAGAVEAVASLAGLAAGRHTVAVRVSAPPGIEVVAVAPHEVRVAIR